MPIQTEPRDEPGPLPLHPCRALTDETTGVLRCRRLFLGFGAFATLRHVNIWACLNMEKLLLDGWRESLTVPAAESASHY